MNALVMATILLALGGFRAPGSRGMTPKAVIAAKFAAVNRHNIADVVKFYSPDARINSSGFCSPRQGVADVQRTYQALFDAYPDIAAEVNTYVVEGDRVAVIFTTKVQVQGKSFEVRIANFFVVRDGLITSDDGVYDAGGRPCAP